MDVHKLLEAYDENRTPGKAVYNWIQTFSKGRTTITDKELHGHSVEVCDQDHDLACRRDDPADRPVQRKTTCQLVV